MNRMPVRKNTSRTVWLRKLGIGSTLALMSVQLLSCTCRYRLKGSQPYPQHTNEISQDHETVVPPAEDGER